MRIFTTGLGDALVPLLSPFEAFVGVEILFRHGRLPYASESSYQSSREILVPGETPVWMLRG